jgi:hypothetical protein
MISVFRLDEHAFSNKLGLHFQGIPEFQSRYYELHDILDSSKPFQ